MYKACKTKQSAQRQQHIVDCLLELMQGKTIQEITVLELCQKAEVPRKSFYRYFESKEDVVLAAIDSLIMGYDSFLGPYRSPEEPRTTRKDLEKFLMYSLHHRKTFFSLYQNSLLTPYMERMIGNLLQTQTGRRLMPSGTDDAAFRAATCFTIYGLSAAVSDWMAHGCAESVDKMAGILLQIMTEPIYRTLEEQARRDGTDRIPAARPLFIGGQPG